MKTNSIQITLVIAAFTLVSKLHAQYTFDRVTIGGGGGTFDGGTYGLEGTAGQSVAGNLAGGSYALEAGFWGGLFSSPRLEITRAGPEAILSWLGSGFVLQSANEVGGPWTDLSPGVTSDGLNYRVRTLVGGARKFFQLRAGQCLDFQTMPTMSIPSPWSFNGATFQPYDFNGMPVSLMVQSRSGAAGPATGLDCNRLLVVDLPSPCASVTLVLASSAQPANVTAHDANGSVTHIATMLLAGQLAPETLDRKSVV